VLAIRYDDAPLLSLTREQILQLAQPLAEIGLAVFED